MCRAEYVIATTRLAGVMLEAKYPVSFGDANELNEIGQAILDFGEYSYYDREKIERQDEEEVKWKTFRDTLDTGRHYSIFTGTKAVPLDTPWMYSDSSFVKGRLAADVTKEKLEESTMAKSIEIAGSG
jgi:hypothetical protein